MKENKQNIKLLLIDDHVMLLDGLKLLLKNEPGIEIVAEATNSSEALEHLEKNAINFVITDINLPGMSGTELAKIIKVKIPCHQDPGFEYVQ